MQVFNNVDLQISNGDRNPFGNLSSAGFADPFSAASSGDSFGHGGGFGSSFADMLHSIGHLAQDVGSDIRSADETERAPSHRPEHHGRPPESSGTGHGELIGLYGQPASHSAVYC